MSDASTTWVRRLPWWDILFVAVPAVAIIAAAFFVSSEPTAEPWEGAVAVGLTLTAVAVWFAYGRRHFGPTRRGYAAFAVVAVLMIPAMVLVPVLGILQGLLYPYMWGTFERVWRSVVMSVVIASTVAVVSIAYSGGANVGPVLFTQVLSVMLSIGIGLAISTAWNVADERQALLDELTRAQEQVRELSMQTGISRERERISRELHDTIAQTLSGLSLLAERAARAARRSRIAQDARDGSDLVQDAHNARDVRDVRDVREVPDVRDVRDARDVPDVRDVGDVRDARDVRDVPDVRDVGDALAAHDALVVQLDQIAELAKSALTETRALIAESAPVHDESGTPFDAAIERLAERFRRETGIAVGLEIEAHFDRDAPGTANLIPRDHQVVLLRCLQEGLSNVRRHAHATRADVRLEVRPGQEGRGGEVTLTIADDGSGFDPAALPGTGFGLPGLRERARLLDGSVDIDSAPGRGATVVVRLPLPASGAVTGSPLPPPGGAESASVDGRGAERHHSRNGATT